VIYFEGIRKGTSQLITDILAFFVKYEKMIVGMAAMATFGAFILAIFQIRKAKKQIRANFSYQIHKDGRELNKSISNESQEVIQSSSNIYTQEQINEAENKIRELLMYYASVYHQRLYGNIDKHEWKVIFEEFCRFLNFDRVKEYWKNYIKGNESWSKKFRKEAENCFDIIKGEKNEES